MDENGLKEFIAFDNSFGELLGKIAAVPQGIIDIKNIVHDTLNSANPDPLVIELERLSKNGNTHNLIRLISKLKLLSANSKFDISNTINDLESNGNKNTNCFITFDNAYGHPYYYINYTGKSGRSYCPHVKFDLKQ